ncbi:RNB domain-containing ribonuclease [Microbacterium sp. CnD16-F]|uniref:RNB domain-containing ribonuclease n=1 Tax=unclassified Microbacterium TaxID=2609290 RepID=UPI0020969B27|nr:MULTISPECIES: RNB domain-containing ribonuclease [unclassified Microbacterium]MCO7204450.1 RNB domain-containing ribonuclease [Microbacterium sp. CnD16-F]MDT0179612.1 RNB domain-containing ribonuclease [Microbacterium sp. ARD31]
MPSRRARLVSPVQSELSAALGALRERFDLPGAFPAEVQAAAERAAREVPVSASAELDDLRGIPFLTIDPEGSTDLDQAVHLERTADGGGILHYAIADVPAFVPMGGAVDAEARRRGQTVYAPDGRIPLHPAVLSEDAASLLPDRDRRAFVWRFELDAGARPAAVTLARGVIRSRAQWSYVDAQAALGRGDAPETIQHLVWFGDERARRESERGGASLNLPEIRVVATPEGYDLQADEGVPLEDANAQVSLLTGMAAAEIMLAGKVGILRTMPPASEEDVAAFRAQTVGLGVPWHPDVPYGDYLRDLPRTPVGRAIREQAAGLFRGAGYTVLDGEVPDLVTQAALAAPYAHTTAPLRRLVDRWSLLVCHALANGEEVPAEVRGSLTELPEAMERSSRVASQVDAAAIEHVAAAVLRGREGEVFDAVVLRRRENGGRVALTVPPLETTVAGVDAEPGATIRVRLVAADVASGKVEFAPA